MTRIGKGNYIDGRFVASSDQLITSRNSARNFETVFETSTSIDHVDAAVKAAKGALPYWSSLTQEARIQALIRLKDAFSRRENDFAQAITCEMGKVLSESRAEAKNLANRIDLMIHHGMKRVATEYPEGVSGETRYHAQGILAVLGPYNFPAHLINAHVIPALLTGNTVVVKFSEVCPWVGEIYAECVDEAQLPGGVFNLVQGKGDIGKALAQHPAIRGILFTGSYPTGRLLAQSVLDEPHKILALEMGGKNIAVVLDDADLYQALIEITQGAFLTTGQRCTATSRVFVDRGIADRFIASFVRIARNLKPGDPMDDKTVFGPLATQSAFEKFIALLQNAAKADCEALVKHEVFKGGAYVTPSIHLLKSKSAPGYIDTELFGPDVCIEVIDGLDDAVARTNGSAYGLSNAIFTASKSSFEHFYRETYSGVLNWNRSTNGASGHMPFGGVGKSGNQRPAGIDAPRYTTFPVAVHHLHYGQSEPVATLSPLFQAEQADLEVPFTDLVARHELESILQRHHIAVDDARGRSVLLSLSYLERLSLRGKAVDGLRLTELLEPHAHIDDKNLRLTLPQSPDVSSFLKRMETFFAELSGENYNRYLSILPATTNVPSHGTLPRSEAMLQRLYRDDFVPREKKAPVIDLDASKGPYLSSIDENPLVIFDAASQIASIGVGFQAGVFLRALDDGDLTASLLANQDLNAKNLVDEYSQFLLQHCWNGVRHTTFTSAGAEANEKALDLCRLHGPGGRRVIAFEGSFHGRTLIALQATYNPQKRSLFEFAGYEATFAPFPTWTDPAVEPEVDASWIESWSKQKIPANPNNDLLMAQEIRSLETILSEVAKGDICAVIIEPKQCEGGDRYATARFFNGLRALTRSLGVPLIFDEVQTGFGLLGPFYFHSHFQLRNAAGEIDGPDCITLAKKAQLGVCLSAWPDSRPVEPHIIQVARGLLQAHAMFEGSAGLLEQEAKAELSRLKQRFAHLVLNPRQKGYAFAFDLPNAHIATQFVNQRFYRGFMAYIAGENTVRFRLNLTTTTNELNALFSGISEALQHIENHIVKAGKVSHDDPFTSYFAPNWVTPVDKPVSSTTSKAPLVLDPAAIAIEVIDASAWPIYEEQIQALENAAYEPSRRDTMSYLRDWVEQEGGLGLLLTMPAAHKKMVLGYAIGGPLEHSNVDGPKQDKMRGRNNTFYSANVVLASELRGYGFGLKLKQAQIDHVRRMKRADNSDRYDFITGRNRIGFTPEIRRINRALGAYTIHVYDHQYGEADGKAAYYRIPLRRPHVLTKISASAKDQPIIDWASAIQAPLGPQPLEILQDIEKGVFTSAVGTKLTLSNWVTPDVVRYAELLKRLMPKSCHHAYFTSGRDEIVDKGLRCLRVKRPGADIVIGLERQYLGQTTAAARSLTDPMDEATPFAWFDWPKAVHPAEGGAQQALEQIRNYVARYSADRILGVVVELIGEKTGYTLSQEFLQGLDELRHQTAVPLVFVESASALGRNGKTLFMSDSLDVKPNMVWWYTGAQLGHVLVDDAHFVAKPLTLISTWDGDEISIRRTYRHLLVGLDYLHKQTAQQFERRLMELNLTVPHHGQGLWHCLDVGDSDIRNRIIDNAASQGLRLAKGLHGRIVICPPVNLSDDSMSRGLAILKKTPIAN